VAAHPRRVTPPPLARQPFSPRLCGRPPLWDRRTFAEPARIGGTGTYCGTGALVWDRRVSVGPAFQPVSASACKAIPACCDSRRSSLCRGMSSHVHGTKHQAEFLLPIVASLPLSLRIRCPLWPPSAADASRSGRCVPSMHRIRPQPSLIQTPVPRWGRDRSPLGVDLALALSSLSSGAAIGLSQGPTATTFGASAPRGAAQIVAAREALVVPLPSPQAICLPVSACKEE